MSVILSSNNPKQLQRGLNTVFGLAYKNIEQEWKGIYEVVKSVKNKEEDVISETFGVAPQKTEGAAVSYDSMREVGSKEYIHRVYALAFALTQEAKEDNLYGDLGKRGSKALAKAMINAKEFAAAAVLNNALTTELAFDGQPVLSNAHASNGATEVSNVLASAADLSESSLEAMCIQISQAEDYRGNKIMIKPTDLIVPPKLKFVANKILNTPNALGSNNNDTNEVRKEIKGVKVITRLSDPNDWYVKTDCPDGLKMFTRRPLSTSMDGDFETGNVRYKADERYSFGVSDWHAIYGSGNVAP